MEIRRSSCESFEVLQVLGRIDGLTSGELKRTIDQAAIDGHRDLVLNMSDVTYMSSAGLRVILQTHKSLTAIGGALRMVSVPAAVNDVFRVSGMDGFLKIFSDLQTLVAATKNERSGPEVQKIDYKGISFECYQGPDLAGELVIVGNCSRVPEASYTAQDVHSLNPGRIRFGTGLAAPGADYEEYKSLFGESVVIGHHFYSYPAVPRPVIDYSFHSDESEQHINFLHGFGFNGSFSTVLRFDLGHEAATLETLIDAAAGITEAEVFGVVMMAASAGIQGMHLKRVPLASNRPADASIFDSNNFPEWMNFPVESEEINKTVVACGIAARRKELLPGTLQHLFPAEGSFHMHGLIMENRLWSNNILEFEQELLRVVTVFDPEKVVHLLPVSKLKNGFLGIIKLEVK